MSTCSNRRRPEVHKNNAADGVFSLMVSKGSKNLSATDLTGLVRAIVVRPNVYGSSLGIFSLHMLVLLI